MRLLPNTIKYKDRDCVVGISNYDVNERTAIVLNDFKTGEPVAALTKNIVDYPMIPGEVAIDVNNCGHETVEILQRAGIIGDMIGVAPSGYCQYPVFKVIIDL